MKFLYSDTQDYVDPEYDFLNDRSAPSRERYWDDRYAHEIMTPAPYDGLLLSMSAIRQANGVASSKVRYSTSEEQRLLRVGARKFLRYDRPEYMESMLMGDCGAFAYVEHEQPAYSPTEVVEFYLDAGFTHGVSPDHIIFDCDTSNPPSTSVDEKTIQRYNITQKNAEEFLKLVQLEGNDFEPMGAVQGWSPESMAQSAKTLEKMGYRYLAIGGLVPLKVEVIHQVLQTLRETIKPSTNIHLLGFAKADHIHEFVRHNITSFDSTSPLIRAFKDAKRNYYIESPNGGLDYYAAIRIPQAIENSRLLQGIKRGIFSAEDLQRRERLALNTLRAYDKNQARAEDALDVVMDYQRFLTLGDEKLDAKKRDRELAKSREQIARTLHAQPWKRCSCDVCTNVGVEVIIFRASNRNKRRGFHNLGVYHQHLQRTLSNAK